MIETKYTLFVDNKNSSQQEEEIINELEEKESKEIVDRMANLLQIILEIR